MTQNEPLAANCDTWSAGEAEAGQGARDSKQLSIQQSITRKW